MAEAVNRMSQNVRTKAVRMTIFLSSQAKFEGTSECSAAKKRLIKSHKRAGLTMDDDPVPKALIDAMDDLDDFKPLLESLHTLRLV
jgi:hypothetical protein